MNIYQFMSDNPVLTFFLVVVIGIGIEDIVIDLTNIILRHLIIRKHGYPPAHCDADGDFKDGDEDHLK